MKLSTFFKKHKWCKGSLAKDSRKRIVPIYYKSAVSFCLLGGLMKLKKDDLEINKIRNLLGYHLAYWNDYVCESKAQLIRVLKSAGM